MRIAIMGYSGSGKSTLARILGDFYRVPVLHFDSVNFLPGWQVRDRAEVREMAAQFMQNSEWVIDGNYKRFFMQERLEQADRILIVTLPRLNCLFRCWRRYRKYRHRTREDMSPGCEEKLDAEFIRWILWKGRTSQRKIFREILREYPQKTTVLCSQKQIDRFLADLRQSCSREQTYDQEQKEET